MTKTCADPGPLRKKSAHSFLVWRHGTGLGGRLIHCPKARATRGRRHESLASTVRESNHCSDTGFVLGGAAGHPAREAGATERRLVVAVSGEPASGKTTAAGLIARQLGGISFDSDLLTGPLRDTLLELLGRPPHAIDEPLYQQQVRPAVYRCLTGTTVELCTFGVPVVASAPFHPSDFPAEAREDLKSKLRAVGASLLRVHVTAQPRIVLERMRERGAARDTAKMRNWSTHRSHWEIALPPSVLVLDNSAGYDALASQISQLSAHIRAQ